MHCFSIWLGDFFFFLVKIMQSCFAIEMFILSEILRDVHRFKGTSLTLDLLLDLRGVLQFTAS